MAGAPLDILMGDEVDLIFDGFDQNGAPFVIPDGSTITLTSNDPTVVTVPATVPLPAGGSAEFSIQDAVVMGKGSTDIHQTTTTPDGVTFEDTVTINVAEPVPGLARVTITAVKRVVVVTPTP